MKQFDIDLVYLWVDGNDTEWLAKKYKYLGKKLDNHTDATTIGRNANNDELKYSLRSVEKNVNWVRRIFIVTDEQTPEWLQTNDRVRIVDIREIIPPEALPCYNSNVIECFLYRIPDLSERFLYANDDMFFNTELDPSYFFTHKGYPIVRLIRKPLGKIHTWWKKFRNQNITSYRKTLIKASTLVEHKFGVHYSGLPHHNVDAYCKSDYKKAVETIFWEEILPMISNHLRTDEDIQRATFSYYALAIGHAVIENINKTQSLRIGIEKKDFKSKLFKYKPNLFCLNDGVEANNKDRIELTKTLDSLFPTKSKFEKINN